jgi:hypothetical protein
MGEGGRARGIEEAVVGTAMEAGRDWGRPEVGDAPDMWGPPVGERERGEKRSWAMGK